MRGLHAIVAVMLASAALGADAPTTVLSMDGNWRAFYVLEGPFVRDGAKLERLGAEVDTPVPPDQWRDADFDDATWQRLRGRPCVPNHYGGECARTDAGFPYLDGGSAFQSLICLRGRFMVTDPAQVKDLAISVEYRGGVVICVNGKEVARANMPAGPVAPDTLAEDYPPDAFFDAAGKLQKENWRAKEPETIAAWSRIKRRIADVKIPAGALRKGVNVLAVEVHRSAYPKAYADAISGVQGYSAVPNLRSTCGITGLALTSPDGRGVAPNAARPEGVQVWNSSVFAADPNDWGDPLEPLRPVVIVACRNGRFTGQVSVGSNVPLRKPSAKMTDLVDAKTRAVIPASAVLIRFGDEATPPEETKAALPVRMTVTAAKDAAPGEYTGTLTVSAEGGAPVAVPVRVSVSGFTLPDPRDYETVVDLIQSPDTLALHYGVAPWSDAHWKLIDRSFEVLGSAGLDTVYLPLIAETHFGNEQSMVRWIRKPDGTYDYDFSLVEKYLDACEKHCGKPRFVCLYAWDLNLEGGSTWVNGTMGFMTEEVKKAREEHAKLNLGPVVTAFDPATGKAERLQLPQYSDARSAALWKPLGEKLLAILKRRGIDSRAMLGIPLDPKPTEGVTALFRDALPGVRWVIQDHIYSPGEKVGGASVMYQANVFITEFGKNDVAKSLYGTKYPDLRLEFPRALTANLNAVEFRLLSEREAIAGLRGFARVGGDLWPVKLRERGRPQMIAGRYPLTNAGGLSVWTYLLQPGPDGARATMSFEMLREGIQETEARVFVERALLDGKVSEPLAERCRRMLVERNRATLIALTGKINDPHNKLWYEHTMTYGFAGYAKSGYLWHLSSDPDSRAKELFDCAAAVSAALK